MKNRKRKLKLFIIILIIIIIILLLVVEHFIVKNGNIQNRIQIIKEMTQSENEANLQTQINTLNASHNDYAINVQNYKKKVTEAITNQGISTSESENAEIVATNISNILQTRTSDATATEEDIAEGKTAYVDGELITGTGAEKEEYVSNMFETAYVQNYKYNITGTGNRTVSYTPTKDVVIFISVTGGGAADSVSLNSIQGASEVIKQNQIVKQKANETLNVIVNESHNGTPWGVTCVTLWCVYV